jgi:phosphoribosylaminoimidazole carboxylase/phosphoribosylaminoimidazole-succinocarboxamide synthase
VEIEKGKLIIKGKTKAVWEILGDPYRVLIESFDDMTKGDGAERIVIANKGALSNRTTCNCLQALNDANMPTNFIEKYNATTFYALWVKMYPLEIVARRKAFGSYLKRNPWIKENFRFKEIVVEYFFKWDEMHDPYVLYNQETQWYDMYDPKKPVSSETYLGEVPRDTFMPTYEELMYITQLQIQAFEILEQKWKAKGVELIDMKCEYGKTKKGEIVLADVIDNDSWRIRLLTSVDEEGIEMSKEVFRQMKEVGVEEMELLTENLVWVANSTDSFTANVAEAA